MLWNQRGFNVIAMRPSIFCIVLMSLFFVRLLDLTVWCFCFFFLSFIAIIHICLRLHRVSVEHFLCLDFGHRLTVVMNHLVSCLPNAFAFTIDTTRSQLFACAHTHTRTGTRSRVTCGTLFFRSRWANNLYHMRTDITVRVQQHWL